MKEKKAPVATDAELMDAWMESVGGKLLIGEGKLKSVKISRKGDRLTLAIKRKSRAKNSPDRPAD
jgi:hypothetical protein